MGPDEDLPTLIAQRNHLGVLRHVRSHELRESALVVEHGRALLGADMSSNKAGDESVRLAALEQVCLAALDEQDHDLAESCLSQIGSIVSKDAVRFRRLLARCLESSGDLEGAEKIYDNLLEDSPANTYALKRKYCILRAQPGKEVEAMKALNHCLEHNMSDTAGWNEMARFRLELGDFKGAAYAYEEVVLGCPLDSALHCQLAEVYATLGGLDNLKIARKHMAQSLELDESNRRALFGLVAVASAYIEEAANRTKKGSDETDVDVAKELVKYGAEKLIKAYKGTKLFAAVQSVMNDRTGGL